MCAKDKLWLKKSAQRFSEFSNRFADLFVSGRHKVFEQSKAYLCGLMQAPNLKRNIERMEESVKDFSYERQQRFISESTWSHEEVYSAIASSANTHFAGHQDACLLLDESCFAKKGNKSAGVSRQWNGRLGKVDNCQVGVFSALNCQDQVLPIGAKLYLPEEWTQDLERCEAAKVPVESQVFKTKHDLALELIDQHISQGIRFNWVGADSFYGKNPAFLRDLDARNLTFMMDVNANQHVYLDDPLPKIPIYSGRGPKPKHKKTTVDSIRIDKLVNKQKNSKWSIVEIRNSSKGVLKVEALKMAVWLWDGKEESRHQWQLIVTRDPKTKKDIKYSLTNAIRETPLSRIAFMQRQRYWIENSFEVAKSICGLADYQVRSWIGWHHHVAMVLLSMLFLFEEKKNAPDKCDLLTANDVREMLMMFLPQRKTDPDEVFRQLETRHRKRKNAMRSSRDMQNLEKYV